MRIEPGMVFGWWITIEHSNRHSWLCRCKCGTVKPTSTSSLTNGSSGSCGCRHRRGPRKFDPGETAFRQVYGNYRCSAKRRGFVFELSKDEFKDLSKRPCFYCGAEPKQVCFNSNKEGKYTYNGIDRLEPDKGYISSNCVPCCGRCNEMKMGEGSIGFFRRIGAIYHYNKGHIDFVRKLA